MKQLSSFSRISICLLFLNVFNVSGQVKGFKGDPDVAFKKAREMAFNKQRKMAQDTLRLILTKYPNYLDVRSFLASTYSWDGAYKEARAEFSFILEKDATRKSDWIANINNELWSNSNQRAKQQVAKALVIFPNDPALLFLRVKAQENDQQPKKALKILDEIIEKPPNNTTAINAKNRINQSLWNNSISASYSMDIYKDNERNLAQYRSVTYRRQTQFGSLISRVNYNRRFQTNGLQYEVDFYPKIVDGFYGYLSYGFSDAPIFPGSRYGAELFKTLGGSLEASLGVRGLKFDGYTTIYTGSIGWYTGNSYWVIRSYVTPGDGGFSKSGSLNYRKYRSDADNYFGLTIGMGFSPTLDRFPVNNNLQAFFNLKSQKIKAAYFFTTKDKKFAWGSFINISREEKSYARDEYFLFYSLGVSYELKFK